MPSPSSKSIKKSFEQKRNIFFASRICRVVFKRFKKKEKFIDMVKQIKINKSTIIFKINSLKLIDKYPRLMKSSVIPNILKT